MLWRRTRDGNALLQLLNPSPTVLLREAPEAPPPISLRPIRTVQQNMNYAFSLAADA